MKPTLSSFAVVTATTNPERAEACIRSWRDHATFSWPLIVVKNGTTPTDDRLWDQYPWMPGGILLQPDFLGVVPAFAVGMDAALYDPKVQIIACLHDDLEILEDDWDGKVLDFFTSDPDCGLLGFGGGTGLGADDIYHSPYDPHQLARQDFVSNLRDAEVHGRRGEVPEPVACLDGFSQIGRRTFWKVPVHGNRYMQMASLGIVHHAYDALLGIYAAEVSYGVAFLPVACHHHGGQTAVGDQDYHQWARQQTAGGDQGFWERAHAIVYEQGRDVLPLQRHI